MKIKQSEFLISAVDSSQYPKDNREEIAFVGRSNVGKSSLINALVNRKKLVKVSSTPGKTRLINFFLINDMFYFVDLPGYGYAKASKREIQGWGKIIEKYLQDRKQLKAIVLILDCRHKPTADDITMYKWIKHYKYKIVIIVTKIDKISKNKLYDNLKIIKDTLELKKDDEVLTFSALNKKGREEILDTLDSMLNLIPED
ncbi:ribosome biogenesis GTP-binding protein YihA/YsxC [Clostridium sp. MT-14]|uniref:ribosome biogenesis GTP-binding protein YihA/YsxC n=1 Tax=Clostridium sp. MT-14 TaxID=3348360 RepID=UPI0035F40C60